MLFRVRVFVSLNKLGFDFVYMYFLSNFSANSSVVSFHPVSSLILLWILRFNANSINYIMIETGKYVIEYWDDVIIATMERGKVYFERLKTIASNAWLHQSASNWNTIPRIFCLFWFLPMWPVSFRTLISPKILVKFSFPVPQAPLATFFEKHDRKLLSVFHVSLQGALVLDQ